MKVIEARNLTINGVVKGANFEILRKDILFLSAKSGGGKSALLRSFYGDLKPDGGSLKLFDTQLNGIGSGKLCALRRRMGIAFEDFKLIADWTVEKNVSLPLMIAGRSPAFCQRAALRLLKYVDLLPKANFYPHELSGGEKKRVAIIRALVASPELVLLDEPTSFLDDYSAEIVWMLLEAASRSFGATIVVATNNIPTLKNLTTRSLTLEDGAVIQKG